jgi:H+/Cl- antiporter ClcA
MAAGLIAGMFSAAMTASVYFFEDRFHRLRLHWMWWPMIGGVGIGIGGYFFPEALESDTTLSPAWFRATLPSGCWWEF